MEVSSKYSDFFLIVREKQDALNIFYGLTRVNQYSLRCKRAELTIGLVKEFYIVDENILGHDLNFKLFDYLA